MLEGEIGSEKEGVDEAMYSICVFTTYYRTGLSYDQVTDAQHWHAYPNLDLHCTLHNFAVLCHISITVSQQNGKIIPVLVSGTTWHSPCETS